MRQGSTPFAVAIDGAPLQTLPVEVVHYIVGLLDHEAFCAARAAHRCFCVWTLDEIFDVRMLLRWRTAGLHAICRSGHLPGVRLLCERGFRLDDANHSACYWRLNPRGSVPLGAMDVVAFYGHLDVVKFLHQQGVTGTTTAAVDLAAFSGHIDVVRFLHENRSEGCTAAALEYAAANGHLPVVAYLVRHWNRRHVTDAINMAATNGHLAIVQFLHDSGIGRCTVAAMNGAAGNGHLKVVQFLHYNRTEGCTTDAMDGAAANGHREILEFLHRNRSEGYTRRAMLNAVVNGHVGAVQFLYEHCGQDCDKYTFMRALKYEQPDVALFLAENCRDVRKFAAIDAAIKSPYDEVARTMCAYAKRRHLLRLIAVAVQRGCASAQDVLVGLYKKARSIETDDDMRGTLYRWRAYGHPMGLAALVPDGLCIECLVEKSCPRRGRSPEANLARALVPYALIEAARAGNIDNVRYLVESRLGCIHKVDALYYAGVGGHAEIARLLCEAWPAEAVRASLQSDRHTASATRPHERLGRARRRTNTSQCPQRTKNKTTAATTKCAPKADATDSLKKTGHAPKPFERHKGAFVLLDGTRDRTTTTKGGQSATSTGLTCSWAPCHLAYLRCALPTKGGGKPAQINTSDQRMHDALFRQSLRKMKKEK
ncbi:Ankyrin repeat domain containing protein [Pandoravirus macleodensis]|uniref:Ankyrin repeat domain containing protein n=1 Tax=Pandoravirus macleodensis TaxID=2107707 RepID=A0A2U7UFQ1_9VIRU|nr:Ankyrin repeat domain containing protein [Pandoravirus macleodensis]AVK77205.1 Ankyrin repeat domain containing protein [Pandoravirus macleodensis]